MNLDEIIKEYCEIRYWKDSQDVSSIRLKKTQRDCTDCGLTVDSDRIVHITLNFSPIQHWKKQCNKCRMCKNPITGKWDMTGPQVYQYQQSVVRQLKNKKHK